MKKILFDIQHLTKEFTTGNRSFLALKDLNLQIYSGETLGLVGESGCGKSTFGRTLLRLQEPTSGKVFFNGIDLSFLKSKEMKQMRRQMQIVFQDPYASLNPRMTIQDILAEPLIIHQLGNKSSRKKRVEELLTLVGLNPNHMSRFPHEFSGGQRQRIGIARALAVEPKFLVCDEPISALDVSIQAQVVNLLKKLQAQMGLTYLFIAHDLSMIKYISNRVAVMYLGQLMELAPSVELYSEPLHPYTKALLSAIPIPDPAIEKKRQRIVLSGDVPTSLTLSTGCPFASRCPLATDHCRTHSPLLREIKPSHFAACHYV